MRYIYRGTEVVAGSGTAYKIEVTGGYEFSGTVTMKATVLNRTTSCSLRNTVTFSNITWWNGSSMTSASNMDSAYPRMLYIIQLNTRQFYPEFKMENAAVGLTVDVSIECDDSAFNFCISGGY